MVIITHTLPFLANILLAANRLAAGALADTLWILRAWVPIRSALLFAIQDLILEFIPQLLILNFSYKHMGTLRRPTCHSFQLSLSVFDVTILRTYTGSEPRKTQLT